MTSLNMVMCLNKGPGVCVTAPKKTLKKLKVAHKRDTSLQKCLVHGRRFYRPKQKITGYHMPWLTQPLTTHQHNDNGMKSHRPTLGSRSCPLRWDTPGTPEQRTVTILDTVDHLLAAAGYSCA